jgi:hypothetical protein
MKKIRAYVRRSVIVRLESTLAQDGRDKWTEALHSLKRTAYVAFCPAERECDRPPNGLPLTGDNRRRRSIALAKMTTRLAVQRPS